MEGYGDDAESTVFGDNQFSKSVYNSDELSKKLSSNNPLRDSIVYYKYTNEALTDSIRYLKRDYLYDERGNQITQNHYKWDEDNWAPSVVWEYKYDGNDKRIFYSSKHYSDTDKVWLWDSKYITEYNNNIILQEAYAWDVGKKDWIGYYKGISVYDTNKNNILSEYYKWDRNQFILRGKTEYKYDANDKKILKESFNWDGSQFIPLSKEVYIHNANNKIILGESYEWDGSQFIPNSKNEFKYDVNNNLILVEYYNWDGSQFTPRSKYVYKYDTNKNRILYEYYNGWDDENSVWMYSRRSIFAFDFNNYVVLQEEYSWDSNSNNWVGVNKNEFSVTGSGLYYYELSSNWNISTNDWGVSYSRIYYYDRSILSNDNLAIDAYKIFPNPILPNNILSVHSKGGDNFEFKIVSSNGVLILDGVSSTKQKNIDVSSLDKGVYLIRITNSEGVLTSRFVK